MKLFVDDMRKPFDDNFTIARNYTQATILIDLMDFDFISLDFDLGEKRNGLDLIQYIRDNKKYPKHINIHSTHPTGSQLMYKLATDIFPKNVKITRNTKR